MKSILNAAVRSLLSVVVVFSLTSTAVSRSAWADKALSGEASTLAPGGKALSPGSSAQALLEDDARQPDTALMLSLLGTGAGVAGFYLALKEENVNLGVGSVLLGMTLGPSLGHFYAGEVARGLGHAGVRLGAISMFTLGVYTMITSCDRYTEDLLEDCGGTGFTIMVASLLLGTGSMVYSVIDAPRSARRHNEKLQKKLFVAPGPVLGPGGSTGFGLQASWRL